MATFSVELPRLDYPIANKPSTASKADSAALDISSVTTPVCVSPGEVVVVVCVVPWGAGEGEPLVGISPAKADVESTHAKTIAINNRFMFVSPLKVEDARFLTSGENRTTSGNSCKA